MSKGYAEIQALERADRMVSDFLNDTDDLSGRANVEAIRKYPGNESCVECGSSGARVAMKGGGSKDDILSYNYVA